MCIRRDLNTRPIDCSNVELLESNTSGLLRLRTPPTNWNGPRGCKTNSMNCNLRLAMSCNVLQLRVASSRNQCLVQFPRFQLCIHLGFGLSLQHCTQKISENDKGSSNGKSVCDSHHSIYSLHYMHHLNWSSVVARTGTVSSDLCVCVCLVNATIWIHETLFEMLSKCCDIAFACILLHWTMDLLSTLYATKIVFLRGDGHATSCGTWPLGVT